VNPRYESLVGVEPRSVGLDAKIADIRMDSVVGKDILGKLRAVNWLSRASEDSKPLENNGHKTMLIEAAEINSYYTSSFRFNRSSVRVQ
jgi:hypothetical protein